jgi:UDP-N-acetylmuramoyl-L-alanyl-D-glutamate--2,6-diaminopimelate ligase
MSMAQTEQRQKQLSMLLHGVVSMDRHEDRSIRGLSIDSRTTRPGDLFMACRGFRTHGSVYIIDALKNGAAAVAYDTCGMPGKVDISGLETGNTVPVIAVDRLDELVGKIASRFYDHPSRKMFVTGITGTNGKTSCSQYIADSISKLDKGAASCGVIGTLGYGLYGDLHTSENTTPDAVTIQRILHEMHKSGATHVVIEVSSHGLDQGRVNGVSFDVAVLTNLSRDHLDYHDSMESYARAKQRLFNMPGLKYAVVNADNEYSARMISEIPSGVEIITYGFSPQAQVSGSDLAMSVDGLEFSVTSKWGDGYIKSPLLGRFNAHNLLATLSVLMLGGFRFNEVLSRLLTIHSVTGRMERFGGDGNSPLVIVDYAHTPDALDHVLQTLREHCSGRVLCVFGCGGDRDQGKRSMMGRIAEMRADVVILTDDNPRSEDGDRIISDILSGTTMPENVNVQRDRKKAIRQALGMAGMDDIILVAGKGHEDFQQFGTDRIRYSDRETVDSLIEEVYQ